MGSGKKSKKNSCLKPKPTAYPSIWNCKTSHTLTARSKEDVNIILGAVKNLPVALWRPFFFFFGAADSHLFNLTGGKFPARQVADKTHPVFCLQPIRGTSAFTVCPCSSQRPFHKPFRYIKKDTVLLHTGYHMDRHSYLIECFRFNIPPEIANDLAFKGEVPAEALVTVKKESHNAG